MPLPLDPDGMDSEKAASLDQTFPDESADAPSITVVDLRQPEATSIGH